MSRFRTPAFHQATQALPDLIHLNPIPGHKDTPPPPLTLLQAYGELMEKKPEYLDALPLRSWVNSSGRSLAARWCRPR